MENLEIVSDLEPFIDFEIVPQDVDFEFNSDTTVKIPFSYISSAGNIASASTSLFTSLQSLASDEFPLYRAVNSSGEPITLPFLCKSGSYGYAPGFRTPNGLDSARFIPTNSNLTVADMAQISASATMLTTTLVLAQVLNRLNDIHDTGHKILDFLTASNKAKQRGNLLYLSELFDNYKHNITDDNFKRIALNRIEEIKKTSLGDIILYKNNTNSLLVSKPRIKGKGSYQKMSELCDCFEEYRIALYLYTLSTFLSVLVVGNFDSSYLKEVCDKIFKVSKEYRQLYTYAYDTIEPMLEHSMENVVLGGIANVTRGVGTIIAKTPIISRSQLDENTIAAADSLDGFKKDKLQENLNRFISNKDPNTYAFIEKIQFIDDLYNKPHELYLDKDYMYLCD